MICPACKKGFPHGTVFCSHCHTTLVEGLAEADEIVEKAYPGSSLVHLWTGENPVLHGALLEALEKAGIPFYEQPLGTGPMPGTVIKDLRHHSPEPPRFGFEVAVLSSNLAAAETILESVQNQTPVDMELQASDSAGTRSKSSGSGLPTCMVWSGEDESLAGFLGQALKENEIPVLVEAHGQQRSILVPPEEEILAREIVREIVEGQPPE
jgi:hypothetical protein